MALKPCIECKKEISTGAKTCPHCGKKNPTTSAAQSLVGAVIVIVFMLYCIGKVGDTASGPSATSTASNTSAPGLAARTPIATVSAMEMWQQYDANEVSADNYYKGRVFRVTGTVQSIDKDFMDNIVLHLRSPNEFMSTSATVDQEGASQAAQLSKGERVSLTCLVKGRIIGSPVLDDCTF